MSLPTLCGATGVESCAVPSHPESMPSWMSPLDSHRSGSGMVVADRRLRNHPG